jgi:uncharacterized coiled-coil protein SlyX
MTGLSRSTLNRATKIGKLSAHRDEAGAIYVDASELARVFTVTNPEPAQRQAMPSHDEPRDEGVEVLEMRVAMLEAALERERQAVAREREVADRERDVSDDLRKRLDRAEARVLSLTVQPAPEPAPEPPAMVEELRRRLEESEAHIRALVTAAPPAPQGAQKRPSEPSAGVTSAGPLRGLLGRLLGR